MKRREFLMTAAAVAAAAGSRSAWAQAPKGAKQSTLDRIAIMTLNFQNILKVPDVQDSPTRTLELFDVAQMIADTYGVHKVEFQHYHIPSTEPWYLKDLRAHIEKSKSRMTQINLEFSGLNISAPRQRDRILATDLTKAWIDHAAMLGAQRVMINQGSQGGADPVMPTHQNKVYSIPVLKAMADYGRSKGIIVSVETRGAGGGGRGGNRGAGPAAAAGAPQTPSNAASGNPPVAATAPPATAPRLRRRHPPCRSRKSGRCSQIVKGAGAYANVDVGGAGATSQEELHQCLKMLIPMTAGSIHTRVNARWDLATAIKFLESELKYKGLSTIEANNGHEGTRPIYDVVVATL